MRVESFRITSFPHDKFMSVFDGIMKPCNYAINCSADETLFNIKFNSIWLHRAFIIYYLPQCEAICIIIVTDFKGLER